jgi:hypothetical protein
LIGYFRRRRGGSVRYRGRGSTSGRGAEKYQPVSARGDESPFLRHQTKPNQQKRGIISQNYDGLVQCTYDRLCKA